MTTVKRNFIVLVILLLIFTAPGITAYLFYRHPHWLGTNTTNKGLLLKPPVLLSALPKIEKWRLLLWNPGACTHRCFMQLDKLARVRLALGRHLYKLEQDLLLPTDSQRAMIQAALKDRDIQVLALSMKDKPDLFAEKPQVFLVNPDNYIILSYQEEAKSDDLFQDLKKLLTMNEKSG